MSVIKLADYKRCYICKKVGKDLAESYDELSGLTDNVHPNCYDAQFDDLMYAFETLGDDNE